MKWESLFHLLRSGVVILPLRAPDARPERPPGAQNEHGEPDQKPEPELAFGHMVAPNIYEKGTSATVDCGLVPLRARSNAWPSSRRTTIPQTDPRRTSK